MVYFKSEETMKNQNSFGRSMIEMLGVLAIVGILSVGGIVGYSKAMNMIKINKTIEQINTIAHNVKTNYLSQGDYAGLYCGNETSTDNQIGCVLLDDALIAPDEMYTDEDNPLWLHNIWGGSVKIAYSGLTYNETRISNNKGNKSFTISYAGLPKEACMSLATYDWSENSDLVSMVVKKSTGNTKYFTYLYENCKGWSHATSYPDILAACPNGVNVKFPVRPSLAARVCDDNSTLHLKFK